MHGRGSALGRLHRRRRIGGVDAQLVEAHIAEAEIRGRRVQWSEGAVAEQQVQPRAFKDPMRAAERQRHAGNPAYGLADLLFCAVKGGSGLRHRPLRVAQLGGT